MTPKPRAISRLPSLLSLLCGTLCLASLGLAASRHAPPRPGPHSEMVPEASRAPAGASRGTASAEQTSPTSRAELALSYDSSRDAADTAIARAQRAVREQPSDVSALIALASAFSKKERRTSDASLSLYAGDAVAAARALAPEHPKVLALGAMLASSRHRFAEARDLARRSIARSPGDPTAHLLLGDALLELGDTEPAVESYQRALDLRPDLRSYNRGAYARWLHGDVAGALELYELALDAGSARDPESLAWCWVDVAELELRRGDPRRAQAATQRALGLVANYVPALSVEARALVALGDRRAATQRLESAVSRSANASDLLLLAEILQDRRQHAAAERRLAQAEKLADKEPRTVALYWARHARRSSDALRLAERELHDRPSIWSHDVHALALLRAGHVDRARAAIQRALGLGTPEATLHLHRGLIELAAGDRHAARASLDRALALDPRTDALLVSELRRGLGIDPGARR